MQIPPLKNFGSGLSGFVFAAAMAVAALVLSWLLSLAVGGFFYLVVLHMAVAIAVWHSGYRPALLTSIAGYLLTTALFASGTLAGAVSYFIPSLIIISLGEAGRRLPGASVLPEADSAGQEETRALLAAIVASSDDAIMSKSLDGTIHSWNAGAEQLLGYTEDEIVGRSINTIIPPDLQDEEASIIRRIRRGERVDHFETWRVAKDGQLLNLSITVSPIFSEQGRIIGASTVGRDITERKRAEQALEASERRFRVMADAAPVLIWLADRDKGCTWFNRQWLDFTGRRLEDEIGNGWQARVHPDDLDESLKMYHARFDAREPFTLEYRLRHRDGEYRWMFNNGVPLYAGDTFEGYLGACIDIDDRKRAEATLQEADRQKDDFLAMLAHELRNPLAPISNALEILKRSEDNPVLLHQSRTIIARQLDQLARLVDDLLNISRMTRDKLSLRRTRVDLASIVRQGLETVQPMIEERGHHLEVRIPEQPIYLDADPVRLAQVLGNLLNNASKFTNRGGHIGITAAMKDGEATIAVRDDGLGIAADQLDKIFDMFSQSEATRQRSTEGLGIGLTLAKRLVELHGGRITAHSDGPGRGSEFTIHVPVAERSAQAPERAVAAENQTPEKHRILLVEDNRDSAETLAILLRLNDHEVKLAYDGLEALEEAERFRPDTVLLDIGLPKLDGHEVCRRIREQPWGKDMTLVALTGWGQDRDRRKSRAAGFDAHMVKPVDYKDLARVLDETGKLAIH